MAYWAPILSQCKGKHIPIWIGATFTGVSDGLAQVKQALGSVSGVLAGCNSEWPEGKHSRFTHSLNQKAKDRFSRMLN
jgi:hypothetical protein